MDVAWFLNQRLDFIRQLYARSSSPFVDRRTKIENEEEPFVPPYSEDPEPAFMVEWQEANDSIDVLGHACLCMLASALQAYLQTRVRLHCKELSPEDRKRVFKKGWVRGYDLIFTEAFKIPFADGPVPIDVLEDIVLTRNSIQHDLEITTNRPKHADRKPGAARSVFLDAREVELLDRLDPDAQTWLAPPMVHVSQASLEATINTVERFVAWLDAAIEERLYGPG
ncbi:TPA: hypothetical protein QDB15_000079 [Burkholderia vietnamiensis]|uniref:RiboL-PSP-HEPN domain-containing protein n=1 Tax=Pandoraea apista TaxID=93218 RepID=A0A5E5P127_9BURK|nr:MULTISPECIES: hypothetical protein [Burkholderiaceae]MCA8206353.1 hypothetical protein [Burkholderia vietnamiensis]VVG70376.1 hypothetical protein PAP18089_01336 [Pandoraea apista]HDR8943151.1 hypothetical protein [Burkholderia vietnamiensis]HDR9116355.1 hypothetical protein [Burkholderia vietnamiensis]HDR9205401.1 hypothetical protein [Burkholderia vietnamiensis]